MSCDLDIRCATCGYWSAERPALATGVRRPAGADPSIGICTYLPPVERSMAGMVISRFPEVHADRNCGQWTDVDEGGPDDGERVVDGDAAPTTVTPFRRAA